MAYGAWQVAMAIGHKLYSEASHMPVTWTAIVFSITVALVLVACSTSSTTVSRRSTEQPRGFFGRLLDEMTERECNVGKFICPYGLGPAGEPCTCTDPSGIVLNGRTVK